MLIHKVDNNFTCFLGLIFITRPKTISKDTSMIMDLSIRTATQFPIILFLSIWPGKGSKTYFTSQNVLSQSTYYKLLPCFIHMSQRDIKYLHVFVCIATSPESCMRVWVTDPHNLMGKVLSLSLSTNHILPSKSTSLSVACCVLLFFIFFLFGWF